MEKSVATGNSPYLAVIPTSKSGNLFSGCIGAVDGIHIKIMKVGRSVARSRGRRSVGSSAAEFENSRSSRSTHDYGTIVVVQL